VSRACVIVLDAVGAGELPDASDYGDEGSDTLGNVAKAVGGLDLPNLEALGLGNVEPLEGCPPQPGAPAVAGRLTERSKGKDTTTGHWELMGIVTPQPLPTYPHGFPHDVIDPFMHRTGRGSRSSVRSTSARASGSSTRQQTRSSRSRHTKRRFRWRSSMKAAASPARS
jgi:phosphopentomutase